MTEKLLKATLNPNKQTKLMAAQTTRIIFQPPVISLTVLLGQKEETRKQTIFHVKLAKIPFNFGHIVCTGFYMYWLTKLRKSSSKCFYVVALYTVV